MQIGMTFDEFVELKLKPLAGADRAFHGAAEMELERMFPMTTVAASSNLRQRGYDCRPAMLDVLVKHGTVKLAQPDTWTQADVDAAASYFEENNLLTPYAAMCQTLGCGYADYTRALREATERESVKYGRLLRVDDQMFVLHRAPARGVTNAEGDLVDTKPAVISFTLADDIRERLERGEEV